MMIIQHLLKTCFQVKNSTRKLLKNALAKKAIILNQRGLDLRKWKGDWLINFLAYKSQ